MNTIKFPTLKDPEKQVRNERLIVFFILWRMLANFPNRCGCRLVLEQMLVNACEEQTR